MPFKVHGEWCPLFSEFERADLSMLQLNQSDRSVSTDLFQGPGVLSGQASSGNSRWPTDRQAIFCRSDETISLGDRPATRYIA